MGDKNTGGMNEPWMSGSGVPRAIPEAMLLRSSDVGCGWREPNAVHKEATAGISMAGLFRKVGQTRRDHPFYHRKFLERFFGTERFDLRPNPIL